MILVTGATGRVGSQIVRQLANQNEPSRIYVRSAAKAKEMLPKGDYSVAVGEFSDKRALSAALDGVTALFHPLLDNGGDLTYVQDVLGTAADAGCPHVVLLSSTRADANSEIYFVRWHGEGEDLLKESGLTYTILHPTWFMQNFFHYVVDGKIVLPMGDGQNSFIDTRDVAAVAIEALKDPGAYRDETLTITGPQLLDHYQVAGTIAEVTARPCEYIAMDENSYREHLASQGKEEWYIDMYLDITAPFRRNEPSPLTDTVKRVTGNDARSLHDFASDNIEFFQAQCPED